MSLSKSTTPINIQLLNNKFIHVIDFLPPWSYHFSRTQKIICFSLGTGLALFGLLTRYLRRRRRPAYQGLYRKADGRRLRSGFRSPNGVLTDLVSHASTRRSDSPKRRIRQSSVIMSDRYSMVSSEVSGANPGTTDEAANLTPQQMGVMGMEALETAITLWENALKRYNEQSATGDMNKALLTEDETTFVRALQDILDIGYVLQDNCELLFLDQRSVLFRPESTTTDRKSSEIKKSDRRKSTISRTTSEENGNVSTRSSESFASAQDRVADLREFEEFTDVFPDMDKLQLYQKALKQFEEQGIPHRTMRTEVVHCGSDVEFLCKLHCIRLAYQYLFLDSGVKYWFVDGGRQILTDLIIHMERDPKDFLVAYESMFEFLSNANAWTMVEEELSSRGVKSMTFYDVVLDLILLDAFDDLDNPPTSVVAVIQNRWLSRGFKETALTTAVWSVLKAKRRRLHYRNGFLAHFYAISEHISPLLAWGFLGPDEELHSVCQFFKDQVTSYLRDVFSFEKCSYTTVENLAADIFTLTKHYLESISRRLVSPTAATTPNNSVMIP